ncbi:MAG: transposase [Clostridia bacterium]
MAGPRYREDFKAQALAVVAQTVKSATQVARELGIARETLYPWMEPAWRRPTEPVVGSGKRRPADQAVDDLRSQIRHVQDETAILKTSVRIVTHAPK